MRLPRGVAMDGVLGVAAGFGGLAQIASIGSAF
jgi:hypothetical protein